MSRLHTDLVTPVRRSRIPVAATILTAAFFALSAGAQTGKLLEAPVVRSELQVRWSDGAKSMQWEVDGKQPYRSIQADSIFLTRRSIYVTYFQMNPLRVQATATATAADDPSYAVITKLIDTLTSIATTVRPPAPAAPAGAPFAPAPPSVTVTCTNPAAEFDALYQLLYGNDEQPDQITARIQSWIGEIDKAFVAGKTGPEAIAAGVAVIQRDANFYANVVKNAKNGWTSVKNCATTAPDPTIRALYAAATLTDVNNRIGQIDAAAGAIGQLADLLTKQFGPADKWTGARNTDYIISGEIVPTFDKMQNVTVKVVSVSLKVDKNSSALTTEQTAAGSASFTVRKFSSFAPEIGVGAVFGTIKQPKYGTGTNPAGQSIVTRGADTSLSVNPSILANFVCRCGSGLLSPMFQLGASASKDLPAILVGGGLRLFGLGKGDVAIGGGAMFAWYKDLQKLKVGDVVTGSTQIDSDLGYSSRPKLGAYFAIQYKF